MASRDEHRPELDVFLRRATAIGGQDTARETTTAIGRKAGVQWRHLINGLRNADSAEEDRGDLRALWGEIVEWQETNPAFRWDGRVGDSEIAVRSRRVEMRVSEDELTALRARADAEGMTVSDWLRQRALTD